jgi:hypothetical protein
MFYFDVKREDWNKYNKLTLKNIFFWHSYMVCDMARGWNKKEKVELWMLYVNEKVDESGQIRLLIFEENSSRKMREWGSHGFGSFALRNF